MAAAVASSAIVHVLVFAALLALRPTAVTRAVIVLPVSLVSLAGGGDGSEPAGGGDATASVAEPTPPSPPPAVAAPAPPTPVVAPSVSHPKPVAKPKPANEPKPATAPGATAPTAVANAASTGLGGGTGGGAGPGGGSGVGLGSGAASPAYGVNPEPPYPIAARRMGLQGTVVLRVVVGADGSPVSVAVLQSSGYTILDASAADTVRSKWRFVPARRNGVPIEDTVQVPIRFHQTAG